MANRSTTDQNSDTFETTRQQQNQPTLTSIYANQSQIPMSSSSSAEMPPPSLNKVIRFGPHIVTQQVFHTTKYSFCLVNLKPLLPGHILVSPLRSVGHLSQLSPPEVTDLFLTVQKVSKTLKRLYNASAFNIAIQDGAAAGQSVAHVHAHVIPRHGNDMEKQGGGDKLYELLEGQEGDVGRHLTEAELEERLREVREGKKDYNRFPKQSDEDRKPRDMEAMRKEAEWLAEELKKDEEEVGDVGGSSL